MSDFEQWWSGIYAIPSDEEAFARFVWQAAIASMQGEEAPKGFALVPIQPTREMERVFREDDWEWRDVLAAADSITEDDYYAVYKLSDAFIGEVIQNVAELPDRNSPDDWPDAMLVTSEELQTILLAVHEDVPAVTYPPSAASKIAEQDARIKELEHQLEVARKDAERWMQACRTLSNTIADVHADSKRMQAITADYNDPKLRARKNDLLERMSVMSYASACVDIDRLITDAVIASNDAAIRQIGGAE